MIALLLFLIVWSSKTLHIVIPNKKVVGGSVPLEVVICKDHRAHVSA